MIICFERIMRKHVQIIADLNSFLLNFTKNFFAIPNTLNKLINADRLKFYHYSDFSFHATQIFSNQNKIITLIFCVHLYINGVFLE